MDAGIQASNLVSEGGRRVADSVRSVSPTVLRMTVRDERDLPANDDNGLGDTY